MRRPNFLFKRNLTRYWLFFSDVIIWGKKCSTPSTGTRWDYSNPQHPLQLEISEKFRNLLGYILQHLVATASLGKFNCGGPVIGDNHSSTTPFRWSNVFCRSFGNGSLWPSFYQRWTVWNWRISQSWMWYVNYV